MTVVESHAALTCHCGARKTIAPVRLGRGIALSYCEPCARDLMRDLDIGVRNNMPLTPLPEDAVSELLTRCVCGSKHVIMTLSLRIGAAFALCARCADDLEDGFRKVLAAYDAAHMADRQLSSAQRPR